MLSSIGIRLSAALTPSGWNFREHREDKPGGKRHTLSSLIGLAALLACAQATAGTLTFPENGPGTLTVPFTNSSLGVPRDRTVGTELDNPSSMPGIVSNNITCPVQRTTVINGGILVPGYTNVYQTGVSGIGVSFYQTAGWNGTWEAVPASYSFTVPVTNGGNQDNYVNARLVVTGPITGGLITHLPTMTETWSGSCFATVSPTFNFPIGMTITANTCSVTTPSFGVTLPDTPLAMLRPLGTASGNKNFNIGLSCQNGSNVYITLTDAANPANRSSNLTLDPSSTARGVALRILKSDGTAVAFGADSAVAGNQNQWLVGPSASTSNVPLTVQYVSVGSPLIAGSVSAHTTFTMSYQ